jgi:hypothetical protein
LFKLLTEDGIWQTLLKRKYVGSKALSQVSWKQGDSHFWMGLMTVKSKIFRFGHFLIRDGSQIRIWEDKWLGNAPLREQYPALYNIVCYKSETIAKVMATSPPDVAFRRDLLGQRLVVWNALLLRLADIQLSDVPDEFCWNLHKSGAFSVDSMYNNALIHLDTPVDDNKMIWKMKIPPKTKVFGWYLHRGVILTKDNLAKRNWHGNKSCVFCHHDETIKHLFFPMSICKVYMVNHPSSI